MDERLAQVMARLDEAFPGCEFVTASRVAPWLGLAPGTLRRRCRAGLVSTLSIGGTKHLISKAVIARLVLEAEGLASTA